MLRLKQFRDRAKGTADLLNYAALIGEGLVLGKDGSLLAGFLYRGPDTASSAPSELNYITGRINAAIARLGTGYALWIDAVRLPSASYPDPSHSHFPDAVTAAIDAERRGQFLSEGAHFETEYAFLICYTPPLRRNTKIAHLIYDDDPKAEAQSPGDRQIQGFERILSEIEDSLSDILKLRRMRSYRAVDELGYSHLQDELINYLSFALTGRLAPLNVPPARCIPTPGSAARNSIAAIPQSLAGQFIAAVAIEGFPAESLPVHPGKP